MEESQYWYCQEIDTRYGAVKRARGCHLYTSKGRRLTDMYQEAGRAILGWGASRAMTEFKNVMNRGITGSFPTDYSARLEKAVKKLLPEYTHIRWYASLESARRAVSFFFNLSAGVQIGEQPQLDAVINAHPENVQDLTFDNWLYVMGIPRWRPWLESTHLTGERDIPSFVMEQNSRAQEAVVVVPPLPWTRTYYLVAFSDTGNRKIVPSDMLPPPVLAATARGIYDLIAELPCRSERDWNLYDSIICKYWKRRGPYLLPLVSPEQYKDFFRHCLDCGLLISPYYRTPSIIPYGADTGNFTELKKNPFVFI